MENKKKVKVNFFSDCIHYTVIEVYEDEIEKVREANRMIWRESEKEVYKRKQLKDAGITILSLESLDDDGSWIADENPNAEEKIISEATRHSPN